MLGGSARSELGEHLRTPAVSADRLREKSPECGFLGEDPDSAVFLFFVLPKKFFRNDPAKTTTQLLERL